MKKLLIALIAMFTPVLVSANQVSIGVKDEQNDIIQYAHATLQQGETKYDALVNSGMAEYKNIPAGDYELIVSADTFDTVTETVTITGAADQNIDVVLKKSVVTATPETGKSVLKVKINYFDNEITNTPVKTETKSYELYLDTPNTVEVPIEKGSHMSHYEGGVTYQHRHFDDDKMYFMLTPTKSEYEITLYMTRNYESRLVAGSVLWDSDSWYMGSYSQSIAMKIGGSFTANPQEINNYHYFGTYAISYVNGGTWYPTTFEAWGLTLNAETGEITGQSPILHGNEFLYVYYYYVKDTGYVNVKYVDENNNEIAKFTELAGFIDTSYTTIPKEFEGYVLDESALPTNAEGQFEKETIEVVYKYITLKGSVIVEHLLEDGTLLYDNEVLTGKLGDSYTTTSKENDEYFVIEVKGETEGKFSEETTKVTYIYQKENTGDVEEPIEPPHTDVEESNSLTNTLTQVVVFDDRKKYNKNK